MAGTVRIGCSGWTYRHWRGPFYPATMAQKAWFAHYSATFDTVEINNSFYRLPAAATFDKWRSQAPPGFRYAVKANRFLTQAKKLKDCAEPLDRFLGPVRHLGEALGPILYQLPPRFRLDLDRLAAFIALLPRDLVHVFEFRDRSWLTDEVLALLDFLERVSFCAHDMSGSATGPRAAGPAAYVRFHGGEGKYWGRYADDKLSGWAEWIVAQARGGRAVWCYFNNDIHAHAIDDALTLRAMVRQVMR